MTLEISLLADYMPSVKNSLSQELPFKFGEVDYPFN